MALTKTQTAMVCAALAVIPLAVQQRAEGRLDRNLALVQRQARETEDAALAHEQQITVVRAELARITQERAAAQTRLAVVTRQRADLPVARVYRWDDNAALVRFPKSLLKGLALPRGPIADRHGSLSPEIREVLQLTPAEAEQSQAAVMRFVASYNAARAQTMRRVEPTEKELQGRSPEAVRVFELPAIPFNEMRDGLFADLAAIVGTEREQLFRLALSRWMPTKDNDGMNTGWAVLNFPYRLRLYRPENDQQVIGWSVAADTPTRGSMSASFQPDEIPDCYRPHIQDWISVAESNALKAGQR